MLHLPNVIVAECKRIIMNIPVLESTLRCESA